MPLMNLRLARPAHIVDINRVDGLNGIHRDNGRLHVGALVRHAEMEQSTEALASLPILSQVIPMIGYPAIRHRGTVVGSIAHAEPAAEWPCLAVALDAELVLRRTGSQRTVPAGEFFQTMLTTTKEPGELLTEVSFRTDFDSYGFYEFARRHGDFAVVAAAVALRFEEGTISNARISLAGASDRPLRVPEAEASISGKEAAAELATRAAETAMESVDPLEDIHGSSEYRRELVGVAVERAVRQAVEGSA